MPNWCNNTFELVAPKEKVREFESFLNEKNGKDWFDFFLPCPAELKDGGAVSFHDEPKPDLVEKYGASDWYTWSVNNWGCKWNCDAQDWRVNDFDDKHLTIEFWFDSPWSPPIALYEKISNGTFGEEFQIFAHYHESGMCFVGHFDDGFDEYYEYSDLESLDSIPDFITDQWNLREMIEERAEWEEEDEEEDEIFEDVNKTGGKW